MFKRYVLIEYQVSMDSEADDSNDYNEYTVIV